jgi:hypothetical protein
MWIKKPKRGVIWGLYIKYAEKESLDQEPKVKKIKARVLGVYDQDTRVYRSRN